MHTELQPLDALRDEWQALQPLSAENVTRLWKKLRLEWNYHSNHIEGNTLTYDETKLLLLHDRTTGSHSHREHLEMKAHDVGIDHVRALAADKERLISERDISDLNKIILKEPFWKYAETPDGQSTRKEIIPGQYKTSPNSVRQANGEIMSFASVEETPSRMSDLVTWLRQELTSPSLPIAACIAKLHHDFIVIHPFEDGNGRVARLLMNYVLIRNGDPPLIVLSEDRENYLNALRLADDDGKLSALMAYLQRRLEWSLQLGIKAAKGEGIEEPSDLEKEVAIFVRNQQEPADKPMRRSPQVLRELIDLGLRELVEKFGVKLSKLAPLFTKHIFRIQFPPSPSGAAPLMAFEPMIQHPEKNHLLMLRYDFHGYRGQAPIPFAVHADLRISFDEYRYSINIASRSHIYRPYTEPFLPDEAESLANKALAYAFAEIKKLSGSKE